jgi:two-component system, sensor histidine kinase and response regulator
MPTTDSAVDRRTLERLTRLGGASFVADMVGIFTTQVPLRLDAIQEATVSGILDDARRHAHSLVSTAGNLGAHRLQRLAAEIESAASSGDATALTALVSRLQPEFLAAQSALTTPAPDAVT